MTKQNLAPFGLVVGLAIILQLVLVGLDCKQTPAKVARNFADAYYYLNPDMEKYVCGALQEESDAVGDYVPKKQDCDDDKNVPCDFADRIGPILAVRLLFF